MMNLGQFYGKEVKVTASDGKSFKAKVIDFTDNIENDSGQEEIDLKVIGQSPYRHMGMPLDDFVMSADNIKSIELI